MARENFSQLDCNRVQGDARGYNRVFNRLMGEIYVNEAVATKQYRGAKGVQENV